MRILFAVIALGVVIFSVHTLTKKKMALRSKKTTIAKSTKVDEKRKMAEEDAVEKDEAKKDGDKSGQTVIRKSGEKKFSSREIIKKLNAKEISESDISKVSGWVDDFVESGDHDKEIDEIYEELKGDDTRNFDAGDYKSSYTAGDLARFAELGEEYLPKKNVREATFFKEDADELIENGKLKKRSDGKWEFIESDHVMVIGKIQFLEPKSQKAQEAENLDNMTKAPLVIESKEMGPSYYLTAADLLEDNSSGDADKDLRREAEIAHYLKKNPLHIKRNFENAVSEENTDSADSVDSEEEKKNEDNN